MKGIQHVWIKRGTECIHVETELGIINIYVGLTDRQGRKVERVSMRPDKMVGGREVRLTSDGRFIQLKKRVR